MIVGTIIGNVWATRKHEALSGCKLMVVEPQRYAGHSPQGPFVAVDTIGAGIGETVLVVTGGSARRAARGDGPVDSVIVGIVDKIDLPQAAPADRED